MDKAELIRFYDNQPDYVAFRSDPSKREDYKAIVDWKARNLAGRVPGNIVFRNILEVGCAFGVLLNNLADRLKINARSGIDVSGENIRLARELFPGCDFYSGILEDFVRDRSGILNDRKFDLILLSDIVEHIENDLEFLKRVRGISEYVLLNLPLEKSWKNRHRNYGESDPSGHLRSYDEKMAAGLIRKAGFEIVDYTTSPAIFDKGYFEVYKRNRSLRISLKPPSRRLFWSFCYRIIDKLKLLNQGFYVKFYGTNYFALLRSTHDARDV